MFRISIFAKRKKKISRLKCLSVFFCNSFSENLKEEKCHLLITDASSKGSIIYANKAFKKLTGHDPVSVIGKTPRILQGAGTDGKVIKRLATALKSGGRFEGKAINYKIMLVTIVEC